MRISAERRTFMDRIIFHIDVNSAYLSWSAIDLLQANPDSVDIRTIPAIIGGVYLRRWSRSRGVLRER